MYVYVYNIIQLYIYIYIYICAHKKTIIPARDPKQCWKEHGEERPGYILQVRFAKISVEDRVYAYV